MSSTARILVALVIGLGLGIAVARSGSAAFLAAATAVEPVGTLWLNAIRMIVMPLVVSLLVAGIASTAPTSVGRIGGRALLLFVVFVGGAALFAAVVAPPLVAVLPLDDATVAAARASAVVPASAPHPSVGNWLVGLVPANPVKAAADGEMLPLIVATVLFALALGRTSAEHRGTIVRLFEAVSAATFVLLRWILLVAPLGIFALALALAARGGPGIARALGALVALVCALLLVGALALYPIAALAGHVALERFARACAPAQALALGTRSSLACLPAMLDAATRRLGVPAAVAGLALPVAVSLFRFGAPILRVTESLFVARLYGIALGAGAIAALAAFIATVAFYTPGIPSGGLLVLTPVFIAFGFPIEGVGLLMAIDLIPDMAVTVANVTADMAMVTVLARISGAEQAPV